MSLLISFTIKAPAKDTDNLWDSWSEHEITIPRIKGLAFLWFLKRYLFLYLILQKIIKILPMSVF